MFSYDLQGLKEGDLFTIEGHYCRRRDWFARLCSVVGIRLVSQQLQQFRVVEVTPAYIQYSEVAALALVQKSTAERARKPR